ncbi:MAG: 4-hydroxythreonine-4-phosphate dehydrogenase PdxA [bacterium]|nr:4-hydroxythreonine-4-phosphate dehydrogenase PdxA [bacterium]
MLKRPLKIGITAGDPAGIGPEVALKAINELSEPEIIPVLIGRNEVFQKLYPDLCRDYEIIEVGLRDVPVLSVKEKRKYIYTLPVNLPIPKPGRGNENTGLESKIYIDTAVRLWQAGEIDAITTGPVNKGFIEDSGTPFTGHTEYIARLINEESPYMMMFSEKYRVLLATTHIPVSKISESINKERLLRVIRTGYESMCLIDGMSGINKKKKNKSDIKIAITGLDPHSGDNGAIGDFDKTITASAIKEAQKEGITIEGPYAADTLFIAEKWEQYDLVIAHYHDQGLIPFKMLAFDTGVNVTLGLSIIRTSVDHGTAYDIAGTEVAGYTSMLEAIRLAYQLGLTVDG